MAEMVDFELTEKEDENSMLKQKRRNICCYKIACLNAKKEVNTDLVHSIQD